MSKFVENPTHFAADCVRQNGQCTVVRENFLFLDDGNEFAAVHQLQRRCGHVVIIPDTSGKGQAWLYHTSCQRMTDVVSQIFQDHLGAPASLRHAASEMMVGELYRRQVSISYDHCRARVEGFGFQGASLE
ncbi:MAG: hypothetical protein AMJ67_13415 [Betaproteobacteria bacterium SG8_41]|nr:MAG: hypothetical protein AMJ67_13415 [Betaproteobacteria bacterium SG8_41]